MIAHWIMSEHRGYKIAGYQQVALVYQLVKGMLAIGAWLSPYYWTSCIGHLIAIAVNVLSIAFHISLLEVSRKAMHILVIGQYRLRLCIKKVQVPKADQCHDHRNIFFKTIFPEMIVY